jgi:hypothetical protein
MKLRLTLSSTISKFIDGYGKHLVLIYALAVLTLSSLYFLGTTLNSQQFLQLVIIAIFAFAINHWLITGNLSKKEVYPYQLLYDQHIKTWFFIIVTACFLALIPIGLLINAFPKNAPFLALISQIFSILASALVSLMFPSMPLVIGQFSYHKEARLCFQLIREILRNLPVGSTERKKIAYKNLRWFKRGFHACNSVLVHKPYSLELKKVDRYHDVIYSAVLIGNSKEVNRMSRSIGSLLISLGSREADIQLREFLIALRHIMEEEPKRGKGSVVALSDMWKTSSRMDRLKSRAKSPLTVSIAGIVALVIGLLSLLLQTLK